ncbi:MAG: ABC transporter permease [Candidatus Nanopelagicales bacterium]
MTATAATRHLPNPVTAPRPPSETLAGTATMIRLMIRRNRVRLAVWWVSLVGLFAYVLVYYRDIFDTQQALDDFAKVSDVPAIKAITGLAAAPNTLGGAVWTKIWMTCALSLALGVVFLVTRNGRADEETGRTELLRSRMLGLHAGSVASWIVTAGLCVAVGVGVALASAVGGLDPQGAGITGSLVTGASLAGVGMIGIGVGAVAGQVASTSRGANGLGSAVLGVFYLMRMIGDLGDGRMAWASPIGWGQQMQPWGADRWWPLGLLLLFTGGLLALSLVLEGRRDLGSGLLPERAGRAAAPSRYATPFGLGVRLQRGPIIGWFITIVLSAYMLGSVVEAMTDLMSDAGAPVSTIVKGSGIDALLSMLIAMIAMLTTAFAIQSAVSLRADEASGILEPQLAGSLSRLRWALGRLAIPAVGSALLLLVAGATMGASYGQFVGDSGQVGRLALAALVYWPAVMVFVGISVALFGWVPRLAVALTWGVLAAMWVVLLVGEALRLPEWLMNLLPFSATPYVPLYPLRWMPLTLLALAAIALTAVGLRRYQQRDIQVG